MTRYKLRIALLTLGVVFGYGSALAHALGYGPLFSGHSHHHCAWE
jgi:hypothetical protein